MRSLKRTGLISAILLIILFGVMDVSRTEAQSDDQEAITLSASAGYDGYYKMEFWVPVRVLAANIGPQIDGYIEVTVGSASAQNEVVYRNPIILPTQSSKQLTIYVTLPDFTNEIIVSLVDSDGRPIAETASNTLDRLDANDILYGVLSTEADELEKLTRAAGGRSDAAVAFLDLADLPEVAAAWNGLDAVIFHQRDSGKLTKSQLDALKAWTASGGTLIVIGGPDWRKTTTGLQDFLPIQALELTEVQDLPVLEEHTGIDFRDPGPYLITKSVLQNGELLIHQDGLPILAKRDLGRGTVYFLALDPDLAPLADWDGSEVIWSELAARFSRLPTWGMGAQNSYAARSAITSLPSIALPSALLLFVFLFLYVISVGPINYVVLRRIGRRELAWVTIPGLVIIFSAAAYLVGFRLKGNDIIINQMSVVYGQAGDSLKVQSLIGLYSPQRRSYDLTLPGNSLVRPFDQGFGGLAGSGNLEAVEHDIDTTLDDVRVDVGGMETFVADSYRPSIAITGQAVLRMEKDDLILESSIQNNSDIEIENAILIIGRTVLGLGDLDPGEIATVKEPITAGQLPTLAGAPRGLSTRPIPMMVPGTAGSPLASNYGLLLDSTDYYSDPDVFARWHFLQAIEPEYGSNPYTIPKGTATLVGWSNEQQLSTEIPGVSVENEATTLYFIELPINQGVISGEGITIPEPLIEWEILGQRGVYNPQVNSLFLSPGWVEIEYTPWSEFQDLIVTDLNISLQKDDDGLVKPVPRVQLWDWSEEAWVTVADINWGTTAINTFNRYVGARNQVRIRLQNDGEVDIEISKIYPELIGDSQ